jgi:small-conductance mechanosensitive channel
MTLNQVITALVILGVTLIAAKVVDAILLRRGRGRLPPGALTRYTALRHTITAAILIIGGASALFVFPSVRGVGAAILSSAAFLTIIIGLAAQASLSNFISGLVISFAQPIRIGDQIEFRGISGIVDDVTRTYTRIRTPDGAWQLIPNGLLASDTIRNWTIVNPECITSIRVAVPVTADLTRIMAAVGAEAREVPGTLEGREPTMTVHDLTTEAAELEVGVWVSNHDAGRDVASALRIRVYERLRGEGLLETG